MLNKVSMVVDNQETVALLGTNGNGKSTLIKCIMGVVRPTAGRVLITIDDATFDAASLSTEELINKGVSLVPEGRRLFGKLTVEENLLMGAYRPFARQQRHRTMDLCFEIFPVLRERRRQPAGSMSGGEQQMLAISRAMMSLPNILLIDEPSVGLAPIMVRRMIDKIAELKIKQNLTVLMAEQNFSQSIHIADRGYVLVHGEVEFEGSAVELAENGLVRKLYLGLE
ncbi:ABC transporter ATP-binding protein [Bradyrhizobium sp. Cp5.3]|uniref:ABC transporter ATP-binding protein n=1 Tax=Bradyrhizobium sp. Cp5.3 TaxID=443598 RepID=UPI001FD9E69B|nr:ABC transporter ATP-binding protein [Bradyrhizobium sp. Cp5.3]